MTDERPQYADYRWFTDISTRWMDNDIYGHINNVTYYSYFDTVANRYLIDIGGLDIHRSSTIGLVVESQCQYHAPLAFPQTITAGMRVDRLGRRSVTYGIAIFAEDASEAAAHGHLVHVFVDRQTRRAVPLSESLRNSLAHIQTT